MLESEEPNLVVWSSIWVDQPDLRIRFEVKENGAGSALTWVLLGPEDLGEDDIRRRRYRLNQLINGQLREAFDQ